jgi:hypothetical protein
MENNSTNTNNKSFSENYVREKKEELALGILKLFNIHSFDEKSYINFSDLNDPVILQQLKDMIPALRTVFQISKNRSLSSTSWDKSKHPGLNLLRQILKEIGYRLTLINEFKGTIEIEEKKRKVYNTKYIIVKHENKNKDEKKAELEKFIANKKNNEDLTFKKKNTPTIISFN